MNDVYTIVFDLLITAPNHEGEWNEKYLQDGIDLVDMLFQNLHKCIYPDLSEDKMKEEHSKAKKLHVCREFLTTPARILYQVLTESIKMRIGTDIMKNEKDRGSLLSSSLSMYYLFGIVCLHLSGASSQSSNNNLYNMGMKYLRHCFKKDESCAIFNSFLASDLCMGVGIHASDDNQAFQYAKDAYCSGTSLGGKFGLLFVCLCVCF
ncbi:hypothetical protein RFI_14563 [Reticulomyxa filosa]|uniref:Uncharacterized protein n=1 Tax=Reticulomyxa filosa TaxID=46433 RepID=X6NBD7_RETFI|nr:hypothetical protein RFI_14563 [Reticulomyxa filosa]|eukprot:ETO22632.1 hypothetical protein RFI_14563 [Reticulomyxa filosa]